MMDNRFNNSSTFTTSNAELRSRLAIKAKLSPSSALANRDCRVRDAVAVLRFCLKPCWGFPVFVFDFKALQF